MSQRVMIFIDGSNLYKALQNANLPANMDMTMFPQRLCRPDRRLIQSHYFVASVSERMDAATAKTQKRFFEQLSRIPHFVNHGPRLAMRPRSFKAWCPNCNCKMPVALTCNGCNSEELSANHWVEKGVDVSLATQMLISAFDNLYDVAILVARDQDYCKAVDEVIRLGKEVENVFLDEFGPHPSRLAGHCTRFIPLTAELIDECKIRFIGIDDEELVELFKGATSEWGDSIGLVAFRNQVLAEKVRSLGAQTDSKATQMAGGILAKAIHRGIFITEKIPHPKVPGAFITVLALPSGCDNK